MPPLELFSLEEKAAQLPGGLFVFLATEKFVVKLCAKLREEWSRELVCAFCVFSAVGRLAESENR